MSDPWRDLDIEPSADERVIKRAYAARLKGIRPDEDPRGFQQLNEAYKLALALAKQPQAGSFSQDDNPSHDNETELSFPPDEVVEPPAKPIECPEPVASYDQDDRRPINPDLTDSLDVEPFVLDFNLFLSDLFIHIFRDSPDEFKVWLDYETGKWPLSLKSDVAEEVLTALIERGSLIDLAKFDHLVDVFGLDDVLVVRDPMRLTMFRQHLVQEEAFLAQATQRESKWRKRGRRDAKLEYIIGAVVVLALVAMFAFSQQGRDTVPQYETAAPQQQRSVDNPYVYLEHPSAAEQSVIADLTAADDLAAKGQIDEARALYTKVAFSQPEGQNQLGEPIRAFSLYQLAVFLAQTGSGDEAQSVYTTLDDKYAASHDETVEGLVAAGMVNLAKLYVNGDRLNQALNTYTSVISRFGFDGSRAVTVQAIKAATGQAEVLYNQGRVGMARAVIDRVVDRFSSSADDLIGEVVSRARSLRSQMD